MKAPILYRSASVLLLLFAIVILYFIVFRRYLGGTVFQRLLGAR